MPKPVRNTIIRAIVFERAKGFCERCRCRISKGSHTYHHRFPQRNGGVDSVANLLYLCLPCHQDIHRDEDYAFFKGWMAGEHFDLTPVWIQRDWWALLDPYGGYESMPTLDALDLLAWLRAEAA
jgi:hypothetical protein